MPPKAAEQGERSLDVSDRQVAIDFFDDESYQWHVRLLLIPGGGGRWIWATPDLEVQFGDLSSHRVVPIARASPYPERLRGSLYAFDPLDDSDLADLRNEARALAGVLGIEVPVETGRGPAAPRWVVNDVGHELFGIVVDPNISGSEDRFLMRGSVGLAFVQTAGGDEWVTVENVAVDLHGRWVDDKRAGPGRDLRVCPIVRLGAKGPRRQTLEQAITAQRPVDEPDWPFRGPKAVLELFDGVRSSGMGMAAYINHYIGVAGVAPNSNVAHELRTVFNALRHLVEYDQVDCSNLAAAELLARRALQIQRAVRRSPKHPDFAGLESMMASSLDDTGGIVTSKFDEWVAGEQRTAAQIMKGHRMYAEERDQETKKHNAAPPGEAGGRKK